MRTVGRGIQTHHHTFLFTPSPSLSENEARGRGEGACLFSDRAAGWRRGRNGKIDHHASSSSPPADAMDGGRQEQGFEEVDADEFK